MRVLVIGAAGPVGRRVVEGALARAHDVSVLALRCEGCADRDGRVHVFCGDVLDAHGVEAAVAGQDAVVWALEACPRLRAPLVSEGTRTLVEAMKQSGVRRLVVLASRRRLAGLLAARRATTEAARQAALVRASGLDYAVVEGLARRCEATAAALLDALERRLVTASPTA